MVTAGDINPFADFDHRCPNHRATAEPVWARMRALPELPRSELYGGFRIVTRYNDLAEILLKWNTYSSASGIAFPELDSPTPLIPAEIDPPLQREYRSLVSRYLARERVAEMEHSIRRHVAELLSRFPVDGHVDFARQFAQILPIQVSLELIGMPLEDAAFLKGLVDDMHDARGRDKAVAADRKLSGYIEQLLERCRRRGSDEGILSAIEFGAVSGAALPLDEKVSMVRLLMFGGFSTVAIALPSALHWLAQHPADAERMRREPMLTETAMEEFVRFSSPATYLKRTVTEDTQLGTTKLLKGEKVLLCFASANRDPEKFSDPDTVILDRTPNEHLGFGLGAHRCIGSHVGKAEMRIAIEEILRQFRSIGLDPAGEIVWSSGENQGMASLPMVFER